MDIVPFSGFFTLTMIARRSLVAAVITAAAIAAAVSTPPARAAWSAAQTVSSGHDAVGRLALASGPTGALVAWQHNDLLPPARMVFGPPGADDATAALMGTFGSEHRLPASYASAPLLGLGEGRVAQLILRRRSLDTVRPEVAMGTVAGTFSSPLAVETLVRAGNVWLAGNWTGELLLAWVTTTRAGRRQVWASARPTGGRFERPQLISASANGFAVTPAVGSPSHSSIPGGFSADMAVVFDSKRGRLLARLRPHGSGWQSVQDIGPAAIDSSNVVATPHISRNGRVTVAWYHQQLSEGGPLGPGFTQVAVKPPGSHRFARPQTLERDPAATVSGEPVLLEIHGRGLVVAFLAQPGRPVAGPTPSIVTFSYSHANTFGAVQRISPAGQSATGLAGASEGGGEIISWIAGPNPPFSALGPGPAVYAALAEPAATRLGAPRQVSPAEHPVSAVPLYASRGGRWILAWVGRPLYSAAPAAEGPAVVRVSYCQQRCT